ncbi:MAG: site-specific integrase [Saprospiraceae bacterium]|nr:site-specific integrase [Saprospiraceae bacterium]
MKVTLRRRKKGKNESLYLDYYDGGKRWSEYLELYLIPEPVKGKLSKEILKSNRSTLEQAEAIRSKRHLEIHNGNYGFQDKGKMKGSFVSFVELLVRKRNSSKGNYDNWDSALKHLKKYVKTDVSFEQINKHWLEGFKEYLSKNAITPSHKKLSPNSQVSYFNKIRAALREAYNSRIIQRNPCDEVKGIKSEETERGFLTIEELEAVANAECELPILKRAFLFSALTGLRWSDINKLVWEDVQHSNENGHYIRFQQQKTKGSETQIISDQALDLLGKRGELKDRVFVGLRYSAWHNLKLQQWVMRAGISKTITFHCARHTYATLQLSLGTDIFTVSKLLGHKDLRTTQIYTKIFDEKKKEAANKIKIKI